MQRKMIVLALILLLLPLDQLARAQQQSKLFEQTAKARAEVAKRGTGEKSRVKIKMRGGAEAKGYISRAGEDNFTLVDKETNRPTEIAYSDVLKVKGRGLSKGAKIGIIAAIGAGVVLTIVAVELTKLNRIRFGSVLSTPK